ncbi:MAG: hypothetical protein WC342_05455 [Methanoregula sp.]
MNLWRIPGFNRVNPASGCGFEWVNVSTSSDGGDFWNNTGRYRVRYRTQPRDIGP